MSLINVSFKLFLVGIVVVIGLMFVAACLSNGGVDNITLHSLLEVAAQF